MSAARQPAGLISVLLDRSVEEAARDDAAMDLAAFSEPEAEAALLAVASDRSELELLLDSAGESLAEIWARRRSVPPGAIEQLRPEARLIAEATLTALWPNWRSDVAR